MKRLSGWDAVLLYSETPTVHMHTLKLAVIELDDLKGRKFGVEEFRKVIHSRLDKLEPFRYELVDIPFKFHHPMWRENCEVDLEYHVRPYRVDSPGGRRQLDEAVGRIASTPLDRIQAAVGDVLHRGPRQRPDRGARQDPPRAGRRCGIGEPAGSRDGPTAGTTGRTSFVHNRSRAGPCGADALRVRRSHASDRTTAGCDALHRAGHRQGSQEQQEALCQN